jgi:hypothetical protein
MTGQRVNSDFLVVFMKDGPFIGLRHACGMANSTQHLSHEARDTA